MLQDTVEITDTTDTTDTTDKHHACPIALAVSVVSVASVRLTNGRPLRGEHRRGGVARAGGGVVDVILVFTGPPWTFLLSDSSPLEKMSAGAIGGEDFSWRAEYAGEYGASGLAILCPMCRYSFFLGDSLEMTGKIDNYPSVKVN